MSTGNGHSPFDVEPTPKYASQRAALEATYPRLAATYEAVHSQFKLNPMYNARQFAGGGCWLYKTRPAVGAPSVMIYYSIEGKRVDLRLTFLGEQFVPPLPGPRHEP